MNLSKLMVSAMVGGALILGSSVAAAQTPGGSSSVHSVVAKGPVRASSKLAKSEKDGDGQGSSLLLGVLFGITAIAVGIAASGGPTSP